MCPRCSTLRHTILFRLRRLLPLQLFNIFGRYEELPDTSEWEVARGRAHELLDQKAMWWEPGYVKTIIQGAERPLVPVYFRIHIEHITVHQGTPDSAGETDPEVKQGTNS